MYVCISTYMYIFVCYVKTYRKIFCIILFWRECSALVPFVHSFDAPFQNSPYGHGVLIKLFL